MQTTILFPALSLILSLTLAFFYLRDRRRGAFEVENKYAQELLTWHASVLQVLLKLRLLKRPGDSEEQLQDLVCLSSLIEQGRFYFPNIDHGDGFGNEKPLAYRGRRNLALDFLVASYNLLHDDPSRDRDIEAELLQRYFTSVVFEVIRPAQRLEAIRKLTDRYFVRQDTFDSFLKHGDGHLIEDIWRRPGERV